MTSIVPAFTIADFGLRIIATSLITFANWLPVMLLTKPEPDEIPDSFYTRVLPGGPSWKHQRQRTGIPSAQDLKRDVLRVLAALMI
jgi:hypothetical protein